MIDHVEIIRMEGKRTIVRKDNQIVVYGVSLERYEVFIVVRYDAPVRGMGP